MVQEFVYFEKIKNKKIFCFLSGLSVLRFDQPNSGNSDGDFLDVSFNDWVETIAYFAKKFISRNCHVALLGQSMGATAAVVTSSRPELQGKIVCLLLWVPDPKSATK